MAGPVTFTSHLEGHSAYRSAIRYDIAVDFTNMTYRSM